MHREWRRSWPHTQTHPSNGPFSRTTRVSQYQKGKTNLDFTEARDSDWQWHQLGHMQVCISLQTDNHASTPPLKVFYRPDALPAAQPTASKHWRHVVADHTMWNSGGSCTHLPLPIIAKFATLKQTHYVNMHIKLVQTPDQFILPLKGKKPKLYHIFYFSVPWWRNVAA